MFLLWIYYEHSVNISTFSKIYRILWKEIEGSSDIYNIDTLGKCDSNCSVLFYVLRE